MLQRKEKCVACYVSKRTGNFVSSLTSAIPLMYVNGMKISAFLDIKGQLLCMCIICIKVPYRSFIINYELQEPLPCTNIVIFKIGNIYRKKKFPDCSWNYFS